MREEVFCKQTSTIDITANMIMLSECFIIFAWIYQSQVLERCNMKVFELANGKFVRIVVKFMIESIQFVKCSPVMTGDNRSTSVIFPVFCI